MRNYRRVGAAKSYIMGLASGQSQNSGGGGGATIGRVWNVATSLPVGVRWRGVCYGDVGLFVTVTDQGSNRVATSPDGDNWTERSVSLNKEWLSVCFGMGMYVALGMDWDFPDNNIMTSPDGINWTLRTTPADNNYGTWSQIIYQAGKFVAVGENKILISSNGINWSFATINTPGINIHSVTYGAGKFVAIGIDYNSGADLYYSLHSTDGINWSAIAMNITLATTEVIGASIIYANGVFFVTSGTGNVGSSRILISLNGSVWSVLTDSESVGWSTLCYGAGLFVAISMSGADDRKVGYSLNGDDWNIGTTNPVSNSQWSDVCYGKGIFVAVAEWSHNGSILVSR